MKIADFKSASKLVTEYNALADQLKQVRAETLFVCFGKMEDTEPEASRKWLKYKMLPAIEAEFRERFVNSIILAMEKIKEKLTGMGVEL